MTGSIQQDITRCRRNTIGDAFRRAADQFPDKIALQFDQRTWTYKQLDSAVNRVANYLLATGLKSGDRVAAYAQNSDAYYILWLACARSGLIHVPINYALQRAELIYIIQQSGASAIFDDEGTRENLQQIAGQIDMLKHGSFRGGREYDILAMTCSDASSDEPNIIIQEDDVVQIGYTSGTTSAPKGAMHTHRSLMGLYNAYIIHLDVSSDDRCLAALPLYHVAQLHGFSMPMLIMGATVILIESPERALCLDLIEAQRINSFFAPPTVWIGLLEQVEIDEHAGICRDLTSLNKVYYGASIMPEKVIRQMMGMLDDAGFYNCFGQTEIVSTVLSPTGHKKKPLSVGRPILGVSVKIVDEEMNPLAAGENGEIVYRAQNVTTGYWNNPKETAKAFVGGWFHSGDLGYFDEDGYLYLVDRIKDVVNTGGVLVASREVEEALYNDPSVGEVAVIGLPHRKWIEAIVAIVVIKRGFESDESTLTEVSGRFLAKHKRPQKFIFVDSLPKNTAGKILKRELKELYASTFD
ncbi:AMP-binding protein [Haliea sp.]